MIGENIRNREENMMKNKEQEFDRKIKMVLDIMTGFGRINGEPSDEDKLLARILVNSFEHSNNKLRDLNIYL